MKKKFRILKSIILFLLISIFINGCYNNQKITNKREYNLIVINNSKEDIKRFGIFIKSLNKSISTDDGFRPFSNDQYRIEWIDDTTVKLEYDFGSNGIWKSETIYLDN